MTARLPRLAVVVGSGSATVREILLYGREIADLVLIFDGADETLVHLREALQDEVECVEYHLGGEAGLLEWHGRAPLDAIITFAEDKIRTTAGIAALLGVQYHSPQCAQALTDKGAQRAALARAGLGIDFGIAGDAREAADLVREIGVACVIKPVTGSGSQHTYLLSPGELPTYPAELYPAIVETRLETGQYPESDQLADIVSVETVFSGGEPVHLGVSGRFRLAEPFRETGMIFPSQLPPSTLDSAYETATRALRALGVTSGATHTELKLTPGGFQVIEVNGRLGGDVGRLSELSTGTHAVESVLRGVCGLPVAVPRPDAVAGVSMLVPPVEATRLATKVPAGELSAIDGVVAVDVHTRAGEPVDYRTGWWAHVACVWYKADDWPSMSETHHRAQALADSALRWETRQR